MAINKSEGVDMEKMDSGSWQIKRSAAFFIILINDHTPPSVCY